MQSIENIIIPAGSCWTDVKATRGREGFLPWRRRASPRAAPIASKLGPQAVLGGVREADLLERNDGALPRMIQRGMPLRGSLPAATLLDRLTSTLNALEDWEALALAQPPPPQGTSMHGLLLALHGRGVGELAVEAALGRLEGDAQQPLPRLAVQRETVPRVERLRDGLLVAA